MSAQTIQIIAIVMGLIAWIFSICSIVPQIISFHKTRNTSGVSLISFGILALDNALWIVWALGYYFNSMLMYDKPMTRIFQTSLIVLCFSYIFGSILVFYTLLYKIHNLRLAKKLKVSEIELAKILLEKDKSKYFVDNKWNNGRRYLVPILYMTLVVIISFAVAIILYFFAYWQPVKGAKEWIWVIVFSFLSSGIWEITCWPQLIKSIREKDTTGLSLFWTVFTAVNCLVTFVYDLTLSFNQGGFNWDVLFVLIFSAITPNVGVMIIKLKNISNAKKNGMTELEYTKKVLIPLVKQKKAAKAAKAR